MPLQFSTAPVRTFGYVVTLDGSLDSITSPSLEAELQRLVSLRPAVIVLNLAKLSYISSNGIRVVQKTRRGLESIEGELKLLDPQPQVARVFEFVQISPLNTLFSTMEELDAYLDKLQKPGGS